MSSTAENQRVNFASIKNQFPYPDFLEVQLKSFQDFLQLDTPPEKRKKVESTISDSPILRYAYHYINI